MRHHPDKWPPIPFLLDHASRGQMGRGTGRAGGQMGGETEGSAVGWAGGLCFHGGKSTTTDYVDFLFL